MTASPFPEPPGPPVPPGGFPPPAGPPVPGGYPPPGAHPAPGGYPEPGAHPGPGAHPEPGGYPPPGGWSPPVGPPVDLVPPPAPPTPTPWVTRREVRAGLLLVAALLVAGVLAGLVWLAWSPSRGIALALGPDTLLPDETENFVAADGRYAVITGAIGLVAGLGAYFWRAVRGPVVAVALAIGCAGGAALTALMGRLFGGGVSGATVAAGQQYPVVTPHLELRATGLLALQALVALLVYGLSVAVAARDDLGVEGRAADDDRREGDRRVGDVRDGEAAPPLA